VLRSLVRNRFITTAQGASVLAQQLRLRGGATLTPLTGADLSVGPAFVWWQLAAGAAMTIAALSVLSVPRLRSAHAVHDQLVLRILVLVVLAVGAAAIVRSFRAA
jgi:hypothetical protein